MLIIPSGMPNKKKWPYPLAGNLSTEDKVIKFEKLVKWWKGTTISLFQMTEGIKDMLLDSSGTKKDNQCKHKDS